MDENNVTSKEVDRKEMTLMWGEEEGTSKFDAKYNVIQCEKREQRNKSLQGNAMSRCNSYKLINEKYSVKVANYKWRIIH